VTSLEFKPGDRVRYLYSDLKGVEGTIERRCFTSWGDWFVRWDTGQVLEAAEGNMVLVKEETNEKDSDGGHATSRSRGVHE
jgi:hypothetical protein